MPSRNALTRTAGQAHRLVGLVGGVVAWVGLALVLLVAFNVLARYLFSMGSVAAQEMEWHLMAVVALFGMSYGINRGEDVRVDMLYAKYGPRTKAVVDVISAALMFAVAVIIAWLSVNYVRQSFTIGEGSPDPGGLPWRFLLKATIPAGFVLLALQAFAAFVEATCRLAGENASHDSQ